MTNTALKTGRYIQNQYRFADICVVRVGTNLRVFQSGTDSGSVGRTKINGIYMNEIIYYGAWNDDFNTIGQAADYERFEFKLINEEIVISAEQTAAAGGKTHLLADFTTLKSKGAVKNQLLNPVNATEWAMYPVCAASGGQAGGKKIHLDQIVHYENYPVYTDNRYGEYDWWGWSQENNETTLCRELEKRPWNDASSATILTPKKIPAMVAGQMDGYSSVFITAKSVAYGDSTNECGSSRILGFEGQPVSIPTQAALVTTNLSASVPKLISNISLFIRLNNFTQNSVNARQGTNSKIIAHLPRFDNSGNETGGLYFEPHEKTYLALGNTEEILINSFDVDFVYENETLCTALTAKTVVCFHIRKSRE